jgi:hypothetical protein
VIAGEPAVASPVRRFHCAPALGRRRRPGRAAMPRAFVFRNGAADLARLPTIGNCPPIPGRKLRRAGRGRKNGMAPLVVLSPRFSLDIFPGAE